MVFLCVLEGLGCKSRKAIDDLIQDVLSLKIHLFIFFLILGVLVLIDPPAYWPISQVFSTLSESVFV